MAVTPVNNNPPSVNTLTSAQATRGVSKAAANRNTALTAAQKSSQLNARTPVNLKDITLASSKSPPPNLPRGSIVDKLV